MLRELAARYPDDVRVVFRHFPLDESCNPALTRPVHPTACLAAEAAECAGEQGRFWPYADLLFSRPGSREARSLEEYAGIASLDLASFRACMEQGRGREGVRQDLEAAAAIDVKVTPTLVINGRKVEGALTFEQLALVVEAERERLAGAAP